MVFQKIIQYFLVIHLLLMLDLDILDIACDNCKQLRLRHFHLGQMGFSLLSRDLSSLFLKYEM